ncbi:hypothetical protein ACNTOD_002864 [Vibrio navarrensis]
MLVLLQGYVAGAALVACGLLWGEFIFPRALLERQLIGRLRQSPHLQCNDESGVPKWWTGGV